MANQQRIDELRKLPTEELDNLAREIGVQPQKSKIETARKIEGREWADRRTAQKLPLIKEIF